MPRVQIYTDGSCAPTNPGPGGWAFVRVIENVPQQVISGCEVDTTNNRMEMTAAIEAIRSCERDEKLRIYTDSQYLKNGINIWIENWKRNGRLNGGPKEVKNADLWRALDAEATGRDIEWLWTKAHSGDTYNELVDETARKAALSCSATDKDAPHISIIANSITTDRVCIINLCFPTNFSDESSTTFYWVASKTEDGNTTTSIAKRNYATFHGCVIDAARQCLGEVQIGTPVKVITNSAFLLRIVANFEGAMAHCQSSDYSDMVDSLKLLQRETLRLNVQWESVNEDDYDKREMSELHELISTAVDRNSGALN